MHIDDLLGIAPAAACGSELLGSLHRAQRFIPKNDFFAGLLPQPLREVVEALFAGTGTARYADDEGLGLELLAEARELFDDVSFVAHD